MNINGNNIFRYKQLHSIQSSLEAHTLNLSPPKNNFKCTNFILIHIPWSGRGLSFPMSWIKINILKAVLSMHQNKMNTLRATLSLDLFFQKSEPMTSSDIPIDANDLWNIFLCSSLPLNVISKLLFSI